MIYFLKFRKSIHMIVRMLPNNMVSYNKRLLSFFSQDNYAGVVPSPNKHKSGWRSQSMFGQRRLSGMTSWSVLCKWGMIPMWFIQCLTGRNHQSAKDCCRTLLQSRDQRKAFWWLDGPVVLAGLLELPHISFRVFHSVTVMSRECHIVSYTISFFYITFVLCLDSAVRVIYLTDSYNENK